MIDLEKLKAVLVNYKRDFVSQQWKNELYKWEAVKHFQDHWDITAPNFAEMFTKATDKTSNLLASMNNFPRGMIQGFASADSEATRTMFINLFDETRNFAERVEKFQSDAEALRAKYDDGTWKQHYQNSNSISTYLWLRYPDKYYIYKYSECRAVAKNLGSNFVPKKGASSVNLVGGFNLYNEICEQLTADIELVQLLQTMLTASCYPDKELKTFTIDVGFYISRFYSKKSSEDIAEWFPNDYNPNITTDTWLSLLADKTVFTTNSLQIMKRINDYGGMATCTQLSTKYGETTNFYNMGSSSLAKRVADITGCPVMTIDSDNLRWWPILYVGRLSDKSSSSSYIWKLRDELSEALERFDLSDIPLYADETPAIWKISHGPDVISDAEAKIFEKNHVIVVHKDTKAKATSKMSQGESFMLSMKKGDYFYLSYGNSIRLLGQIATDEVALNPEKEDGWYQREYTIVAKSKDYSPYRNTQKWWTPNDNSTCIMIGESDKPLFEKLILKPYFDLTLDSLLSNSTNINGYWWLNANPKIWSFSEIGIGETQSYTLYNDNGNKRRIFQNFLDAKAGELIIGYESYPVKQVVAIAKVTRESDGENLYFEKVEGLATPIDYATLKNSPELERMEYFTNPQGSLFKLTKGEYEYILDIIREENPVTQKETVEAYSKEKFLEEVYMTNERFDTLVSLLKNKQNLILQGAPGVGKTFAARRLAYAVMKDKDDSRIEFIQFHQNYSYEDFIMGYKPQGEGFELKNGVFYRFCQKAANTPNKLFFFIIDEINRGNMSKIFGELLMLIEKDYRGTKATLAYNGMPFTVPNNLYIIGMMNTADRSLAMIDYALRRRFSFFEIEPGFNSDGFRAYQVAFDNDTFNTLIEQIKALNKEIATDGSLGKGFCIGHSYFCGQEECTDEWMMEVVEYDIIPMLSEYWFDEPTKLQRWEKILRGVIDD
ncbi:AAA family ATPase [Brevibacillus sp. DP1.3A]|uniref:AAA family ATPase n=1 Tax=Brevibacillus sp. DP1.3A TaxID=2738867 RepID=UPI00156AF147|nr:AAA family ATPase [Brevibacillus sp. DP1.3A]UED72212.1 EVE domain-containing protein [Brevibacillus sp. DP1.3A]